ncbi:MAG TPA: hypothetical protein VF622_11430 [Segetibacter sp.]|jgi:hypothetical protein
MKKLLLLFFVLIVLKKAQAQFLEKVYLKDSITVHEGWIIEQVPQEYLKMLRRKERDTITIDVTNIWKIARDIDVKKLDQLFKVPPPDRKGLAQSFYLELLGAGGVYSVNYDRRFTKGHRDGWGARAGFGYLNVSAGDSSIGYQNVNLLTIPVDVNYIFGKKKGALQLGVGLTYISSRSQGRSYTFNDLDIIGGETYNYQSNGFAAFLNVSYITRSLGNGFMFRAALTPVIYPVILPSIGLSFGYNFQKR